MKKYRLFVLHGVLLFFVGVGVSHALTVAELTTKIRSQVRDTATTASLQRYSDAFILTLINEGQRDAVNQTWCLSATTGYSLVSGQKFYQLPSDLIAIKFARFIDVTPSSSTYVLDEKNERSFRQQNMDWEKQKGKPVNYFTRDSTYTLTTYELAVYPIPTATSDLGTMIVDYYQMASDLVNSTDVPFRGQLYIYPYHDILADYATARIKVIEGRVDEATFFGNLYTAGLAVINSKLNAKPNWNPSFSGATK